MFLRYPLCAGITVNVVQDSDSLKGSRRRSKQILGLEGVKKGDLHKYVRKRAWGWESSLRSNTSQGNISSDKRKHDIEIVSRRHQKQAMGFG